MANRTQTVEGRVFIAETETDVLSFRTSHGTGQPVGSCDLTLALPLPDHVVHNATVEVEYAIDGVWESAFAGVIRTIDRALSTSGYVARLDCDGHAHRLDQKLDADLAWTGGNPVAPTSLDAGPIHVGAVTSANYADPTPEGTTVDRTFTPVADAAFVTIAGRLHSTSSRSRIELWQGGTKLGYANFPIAGDNETEDFTDDDEWEDFTRTITASITLAGGDVTVRAVAGHTPGSAFYDNFEVKTLTWATADKTSVRDIVRSLFRGVGYADLNLPHQIDRVVDLDGDELFLGGNPLVDAGQVIAPASTTPLAFSRRILDLFGYDLFDTPGGATRVRAVRGMPLEADAVLTLTEGADPFSVNEDRDARRVVNWWTVEGPTPNNEDGVRIAYRSAPASVPANPNVPTPPGVVRGTVTSSELVSDALCQAVREIREVDYADVPVVATMETWPRGLQPGDVVLIDAPSLFDDPMPFWLTGVSIDFDASGLRAGYEFWAGSGEVLPEEPDVDDSPDVSTDPFHVGDTAPMPGWAVPSATGTTETVPFTAVLCDGVRVSGRSHGANDFATVGSGHPVTYSTIEVWQSGVQKGSVKMPQSPEYYGKHYNFAVGNTHWRTFRVDIAAPLAAGAAELRFVSGLASLGGYDDFEVKDLAVVLTGIGAAVESSVPIDATTWRPYTPVAGAAD
jgi:hypothetical protein